MSRLLLVDDEQGILDALKDVLTAEGHAVDTAPGGREALEKIERDPPDLMLLDILMPGSDGIETLRRALELRPELGVIMVTAVYDEEIAREAMALGAFDYVTKPLDINYLKTSVLVKSTLASRWASSARSCWWSRGCGAETAAKETG